MKKYDFARIEKKWQRAWEKSGFSSWRAKNSGTAKKMFILDMFPYPSGEGLHVGHLEGYTATDIYARFLRMNGWNVLHPMGWDAFGLPAENYAIQNKIHPNVAMKKNIARFKKQIQSVGLSYDWSRELATSDPAYYKWTQWMFLQMFHHGLAYESNEPINWCPLCKTTLANEDLENGRCERCKSLIERKPMRQWVLRITMYADRLLNDLKQLEWSESVKEMQRNWIGKSTGYEFSFRIKNSRETLPVFTTRLDTLYGVTFVVLAPEHPLVESITTPEQKEKVRLYMREGASKTDLDRAAEKEKTGVFSGAYAIHPITKQEIPIWIADYVLMDYAFGSVMGVPAHDERDFAFAHKYHLPIREVISPDGKSHEPLSSAYTDIATGMLIHSGPFDRLSVKQAAPKIAAFMSAQQAVKYKLQDWTFARQRYWGEPFPLVFCEQCKKRVENSKFRVPLLHSGLNCWKLPARRSLGAGGKIGNLNFTLGEVMNPGWIGVPEEKLPVVLPNVTHYEPTGTGASPLASIDTWVSVKCPKCGGPAKRETDTMPQWAGSCWYYLGFILGQDKLKLSAKRAKLFWDQKVLKYWLTTGRRDSGGGGLVHRSFSGGGVGFYVGGTEHATRHLIYARFWHKFLQDIGVVPNKEPFAKLVNQGMVLGSDGEKMSKSRGNVVNPDDIIKQYGADTLRMYEMFLGPLEASKPWDTNGIVGVHRFLSRVFSFAFEHASLAPKKRIAKSNAEIKKRAHRLMHQTVKKVGDDISHMRFNTAISALMEFQNELLEYREHIAYTDMNKILNIFTLLLYPFAPHLASELWSMRNASRVEKQPWPKYNPAVLVRNTVTYVIQVSGKVRDTLTISVDAEQSEVIKQAQSCSKVSKWLETKKIKRVVFVKGKIVNFVV